MKKEVRLYNMILPVWLLVLFPQVWLITIPGNLIIDCAVVLITLKALGRTDKGAVLKQVWWKVWLLGFAADAVGVLWLILGLLPALEWPGGGPLPWWSDTVGHIVSGNVFSHPLSFLWMLVGVGLAGVCIYFFDRKVLRKCPLLTPREAHLLALTLAIVTAPWTFFIPVS